VYFEAVTLFTLCRQPDLVAFDVDPWPAAAGLQGRGMKGGHAVFGHVPVGGTHQEGYRPAARVVNIQVFAYYLARICL
jgi:hypothetical protein